MALIANDIAFVVIRRVPENTQQWWPVECFSTRALAQAYINARVDGAAYVIIDIVVTS